MKLTAQDLKITLGTNNVLNGVDIEANTGEFIGVIGPNGSGKSTLLKCIYRVLNPSHGAVYLDGQEMTHMPYKKSAQNIAVLAQHNYYNFDFSVREVVLMGRAPHKRTMERDNSEDFRIVDKALETVGMSNFKTRSFSTLSGGEQQRVILARALAQQTPCLILDEPTNHLDITYQLQLMDLVKGLNRTIIAAIHDLNIASMYCTKLFVMKNGKVVGSGTPEEILTEKMLKEVYEVNGKVYRDEQGFLRVVYYPKHYKEG